MLKPLVLLSRRRRRQILSSHVDTPSGGHFSVHDSKRERRLVSGNPSSIKVPHILSISRMWSCGDLIAVFLGLLTLFFVSLTNLT